MSRTSIRPSQTPKGARTLAFESKTGHLFAMAAMSSPPKPEGGRPTPIQVRS